MTIQEKQYYEKFMYQCIALAKIAKNRGDSPVGSIIVNQHTIIAEGIEAGKTKKDITFHAEIEAIRNAVKKQVKQIYQIVICLLHTNLASCVLM